MCDDDTTLLYRDAGGAKRRLMDEAKRLCDQLDYLCNPVYLSLAYQRAMQRRAARLAPLAHKRYERRQRAYFTTDKRED